MKHPQTAAMELYDHFKDKRLYNIQKYGCCAFVLMWCLGLDPSDVTAIATLDDMISHKVIKEDCTVRWAEAIRYLSGREMTSIDFLEIKTISDIKERTPVRFDFSGQSHWVGVENGQVVFNPLKISNCVMYGRPTQKRVLHIKGVEL